MSAARLLLITFLRAWYQVSGWWPQFQRLTAEYEAAWPSFFREFLEFMGPDGVLSQDHPSVTVRSCPDCGSGQCQAWHRNLVFPLVRCGACGFTYARNAIPQIESNRIRALGRQRNQHADVQAPSAAGVFAKRLRAATAWLDWLCTRSDFAPKGVPAFLDIGAGTGAHVRAAALRGWHAVGVELDPEAVRLSESLGGGTLIRGSFEEAVLQEGSFDVIRINHVLEHMLNPAAVLRKTATVLRPGGCVWIGVPNSRGTISTLFAPYSRDFSPNHVNFFTAASLRRMCRAAGLVPRMDLGEDFALGRYLLAPWEETILSRHNFRGSGWPTSWQNPRAPWRWIQSSRLWSGAARALRGRLDALGRRLVRSGPWKDAGANLITICAPAGGSART